MKDAVKLLLDGVDYHAPPSDEQRKASLAETLRSEFSVYRHDSVWFDTACRHAAKMAEHSILSSENPEHTGLSRFHEQLRNMYLQWDTISANCIASSAMEYVNGCVLEELQAVQDMKISESAESWPDYLRDKTGIAAAYAFMIFPKSRDYKVSDFIQTIGDIMIFINLANDVLSFYKEEKAGESGNYIHNRAYINGKSTSDTLKDVSRDAVAAYLRVSAVLESQSTASYEMWKTFGPGYMYASLSFFTILSFTHIPARAISMCQALKRRKWRAFILQFIPL
ncbi:hypothetical protein DXG01_006240 [Tephrocybe rancida]|nr:hypothetical protein DXG01_006240 [Tephrocybe rancida]